MAPVNKIVEELGTDATVWTPLMAGCRVVDLWGAGAKVDERTGVDRVAEALFWLGQVSIGYGHVSALDDMWLAGA